MYYGDTLLHNDHEVFRLKRASRLAATTWRFRDFECREVRAMKALVARMMRPLAALLRPKDTATRPRREQLSY